MTKAKTSTSYSIIWIWYRLKPLEVCLDTVFINSQISMGFSLFQFHSKVLQSEMLKPPSCVEDVLCPLVICYASNLYLDLPDLCLKFVPKFTWKTYQKAELLDIWKIQVCCLMLFASPIFSKSSFGKSWRFLNITDFWSLKIHWKRYEIRKKNVTFFCEKSRPRSDIQPMAGKKKRPLPQIFSVLISGVSTGSQIRQLHCKND